MSNINTIIDYYHSCFKQSDKVKNYAKMRKISKESVIKFKLGYCPPNSQHAPEFVDRLIFPIWDAHGTTVGWTGRAISPEQSPKYRNVKESIYYKKSRILYNYNLAKLDIFKKQEAILVEGQLDVIMLSQIGIINVVASSGTGAFKVDAASLLARYAKKVYVVFDADSAGILAADGAKLHLQTVGVPEIILITLPKGHDPASYIIEFGKESFMRLLNAR